MRRIVVWRWAAEVTGVALIATGAWWRVDPFLGMVIGGVYLVLLGTSIRGGS